MSPPCPSGLSWFHEDKLAHDTEIFGWVGHRFSTYRKQGEDRAGVFDVHGRISTQVVHTPAGWRISAMAWDDERPGLSLADSPTRTGHAANYFDLKKSGRVES